MKYPNKILSLSAISIFALSSMLPVQAVAIVETEDPVASATPTAAQARTLAPTRVSAKSTIQAQREQNEAIRATNIATKCSLATTRVDTLTERYEQNRLRYVNRYNKLITRLENLSQILTDKNIDSLNLNSEILVLKEKVNQFNTLVDQAMGKLNETKQFACGNSEGAYLEKLREAKSASLQVRVKAQEINNYFALTIVPELQQIKANNQQ